MRTVMATIAAHWGRQPRLHCTLGRDRMSRLQQSACVSSAARRTGATTFRRIRSSRAACRGCADTASRAAFNNSHSAYARCHVVLELLHCCIHVIAALALVGGHHRALRLPAHRAGVLGELRPAAVKYCGSCYDTKPLTEFAGSGEYCRCAASVRTRDLC